MSHKRSSEAEVLAAALRALAADYKGLNWSLFREQLSPIPLVFVESRGYLGRFCSDPRRIEISKSMVLREPWGVVLEVLKHEMAHQFVEEVLGEHEETAHGATFQQVCSRFGIDAKASGAPEVTAETTAILERIAKLLALADSPNPHEAEAAMRTAHRLMLKHNLEHAGTRAQPPHYSFRHLGKPTGRTNEAERVLAGLLGEFFFVQPIWVSVFRIEDQKRAHQLEVTGRHENLAMAAYVYDFLIHSAEALWRSHKKKHGIERNADRQAFRAGVIRGFADKLRAERKVQQGVGLVWVGDPEANRHFKRRHPRVASSYGRSTANSSAAHHGRQAGQQIILRRPLAEPARSRGRLLPS